MENIFTFHKTIRGYNHIRKDIPCEDFSAAYSSMYKEKSFEKIMEPEKYVSELEPVEDEFISEENMNLWEVQEETSGENQFYYIAVVADGHGDSDCVRSQIGSKFIVDVAMKCLEGFAHGIYEDQYMFKLNECRREYHLNHITDTIVSQWNDKVRNHLEENPLTEDEIGKLSAKAFEAYKRGESLPHLYGTTVIGAMLIDHFLILIQQGDGRCEVFYENGQVDQPIPWDERCIGNVTTSMCDADVNERFRHYYIDLEQNPVSACFVGTDGIEDSYRNMEGTHMFYRNCCLKLINSGIEKYEYELNDTLSELSRTGSGDDISIAGIIWMDKLSLLKDSFIRQNKKYPLEEFVAANEKKLISMERKYNFLQEERDKARKAYCRIQDQYEELNEEYKSAIQQQQEIQKKLQELEEEIYMGEQESKRLLEETTIYSNKCCEFLTPCSSNFIKRIIDSVLIPEKLYERLSEAWEDERENQQNEIKNLKGEIQQKNKVTYNMHQQIENLKPVIDELKQKDAEACQQFEEYDLKRNRIKELLENAKRELKQLNDAEY